jgi:hypothetical protein
MSEVHAAGVGTKCIHITTVCHMHEVSFLLRTSSNNKSNSYRMC